MLDVVAPQVALVTETNVPHEDNVSYFGDGTNEAQMVYNFALPPLVLHSFQTGSCERLARWAAGSPASPTPPPTSTSSPRTTASACSAPRASSRPRRSQGLVDRCRAHGGLVSYRDAGDGTQSPYELNMTWYSALNRDDADEPQSLQVDRFIASRAIALALRGVPGIYLPSLFGAKNDTAAVLEGREARAINRKTTDEEALFALLGDRGSWVYQVAVRLRRLIKRRVGIPAFHPNAEQRVLFPGDGVFAVLRETRDGRQGVLALTNVTALEQRVRLRERRSRRAGVSLDRPRLGAEAKDAGGSRRRAPPLRRPLADAGLRYPARAVALSPPRSC